jgi:acyl-CoA:acyl-CoA alkyltransferase
MIIEGHSQLHGVGAHIPGNIVTSDELLAEAQSESFGVPTKFISSIVGIEERRFSEDNDKPSTLAIRAAQTAIENSNVNTKDIGLVIYCGIERDNMEPATAHTIQHALGINATCFDVSNACHGFMNGIAIADSLIAIGTIEHALIVTGEKGSAVTKAALKKLKTCTNAKDFRRWIGALTVGDAGGAVILGRKQGNNGFKKIIFHTDSQHNNLCYYNYNEEGIIDGQMLMRPISNAILKLHSEAITKTYETLNWQPDEVDKIVSHQVGWKPHLQLTEAAKMPQDKATCTVKKFGNLTSATIPVNLYMNQPKQQEKILMLGTGSGLSICQTGLVWGG